VIVIFESFSTVLPGSTLCFNTTPFALLEFSSYTVFIDVIPIAFNAALASSSLLSNTLTIVTFSVPVLT